MHGLLRVPILAHSDLATDLRETSITIFRGFVITSVHFHVIHLDNTLCFPIQFETKGSWLSIRTCSGGHCYRKD